MIVTSACRDSVSLKPSASIRATNDLMFRYKAWAVAFSYPDDDFFKFYPQLQTRRQELSLEYDRLFRQNEIWLYGAEHLAENEFQRSRLLSDIAGFYKAFGLETYHERPDFLVSELEFIHYLIYKEINAPDAQKRYLCQDAQKKFFNEHFYPAAKKITEKIIQQARGSFYIEIARVLLESLEAEKKVFRG